jgi:RHS repeat-associated protein
LTNVFNHWRYTGQYQDTTTGLYEIGARYYQPELGRWTQRDPSGQEANAYLYVGGDPVNFTDPSGLSVFSEFKDYLTAEDAEKAVNDPGYNNRFSNAEATAANGVRDAGEFLGDNASTVYTYGFSCIQYGAEGARIGKAVPKIGPGVGAAIGCGVGLGAAAAGDALTP